MKRFTQFFQALLGVGALLLTAILVMGRFAWRTISKWWKNCSKWARYLIVTVVVLLSVGYVVLVIHGYYKITYNQCYWRDKTLSKNVVVRETYDNKYRVYNRSTRKYTTPKVNWVSGASEEDSLVVYALTNKRGYINSKTGEIVIDAEKNDYHKAWVFSEGLAAVMKDGKIGFINSRNEVVIPFKFDYSSKCRMFNFGYLFHDGYCIMTNKDGDLGLINKSGDWVLQPAYDEIWAPHKSGYRIIGDNGKFGIFDTMCNEVYPIEYDYIVILSDRFVLTQGGRKWQVDYQGNVIQSFMFDDSYYLNYPIGYNESGEIEYAFADYVKYTVMNRFGIMNRITGNPITPALYLDVNMLSKDLFEVQDPESRSWYLLDKQGNVISAK